MKIAVCFEVDPEQQLSRTEWMWLVRWRYGKTCERCGENELKMQAHHKNKNGNDNRLANGECLCKRCHDLEHRAARSENMKKVRPKMPRRTGIKPSAETREKMRRTALARTPEFYARCMATKHEKGLDLAAVAKKSWETRRKNNPNYLESFAQGVETRRKNAESKRGENNS